MGETISCDTGLDSLLSHNIYYDELRRSINCIQTSDLIPENVYLFVAYCLQSVLDIGYTVGRQNGH